MSAHPSKVEPSISSPRRVILVSIDWTRDKDPRLPLGHASLVAALRSAGVDTRAFSFAINRAGFDEDRILRDILESAQGAAPEQVDVGFGVYVWNDPVVKRLLSALRHKGFQGRIILGGPQISYAGSGLEQLYPEADAFIRGYGEEALVALAATFERIRFMGVHWAGQVDSGVQARAQLESLSSPFLEGVIELSAGQRFIRWETQRGCPFRCSFCQHREAGSRLRRRDIPLARLEREMELFVRSGVDDIAVLDPLFNLGAHALAVLRTLRRLGYGGRLSLQCHFSTLDEEFLDACQGLDVRLEFGLQTIHEREARAVERVNDMAKVRQGLRELHERHIRFEVSIIFGLPEQTLESFRETIDFCLQRGVPTLKAFPLMLLRGTALERERARWGLVENDEPIPSVIRSHTFGEREWKCMAALADALRRTEGGHPGSIEALDAWVFSSPDSSGWWSPAADEVRVAG
ncbi:Radical SAM domain protein [Cystobacter fuscus DSM 2262]|uniref:Radical SAM domain protein n=1 Tax=Cystobacter fuscus (strain ATCC 25194 / DSM 2262 / NBRC 100088 / M29) TaxID=1242864 RepID=S9PIP0_CYSF2|nr:B12-binding domain-containing radical SAM protein [Cystobacter fuscus]EPX62951.1 Radical SAM domain protein [Cystobacter fuscus DSM 2262]